MTKALILSDSVLTDEDNELLVQSGILPIYVSVNIAYKFDAVMIYHEKTAQIFKLVKEIQFDNPNLKR